MQLSCIFNFRLNFDGLIREPCSRTDILFTKKNGGEIFTNLFGSLEKRNNTIGNMNAVYTTLALFCVELFCEETLFDFIRLAISFQELAVSSAILSAAQKIHLHVVAICLFALIAHFLPVLKNYSDAVVMARKNHAIHLIPPLRIEYAAYEPSQNFMESCLLSHATILEVLKEDGIEVTNKSNYTLFPRHSWVDAHIQSSSNTDLNNISVEVDSGETTPVQTKVKPIAIRHWYLILHHFNH